MDETPERLRRTIAATHEELNDNINALETKAKDIVDWRHQFDKRPLVMLGLAVGGGMIAAAVLGGRSRSRRQEPAEFRPAYDSAPRVASEANGTWHRLRGVLGSVAASAALDLLHEAVPGLKERLTDPIRKQMAAEPRRPGANGSRFGDTAPAAGTHGNGYNSPDAG